MPPPVARKTSPIRWVAVALAGVAGIFVLLIVGTFGVAALIYKASTSEADAQAKQYWDKNVKQCGSRYFQLDFSLYGTSGVYREYKGFSYAVWPSGLTEADKLNGYEWKGFTSLHSNSYRTLFGRRWSEWKDGSPEPSGVAMFVGSLAVPLDKKNGRWYYFGQDSSKYVAPRIDCEKLLQ
jgi:hypothetical protein